VSTLPLKILLVCREFFGHGGAASRWRTIAHFLCEKEHDVFVMTQSSEEKTSKTVRNKQMYIVQSALKPRLTSVPFGASINVVLLLLDLLRFLQKIDVDLIIVTIPEIEEGIACAIASKIHKKTSIFDVRDVIVEDYVNSLFPRPLRKIMGFILAKLLTWAINSSTCVVTVTQTLRKFLVLDGVQSPLYVVPNGADTTLFHPSEVNEKMQIKRSLGFDGNLNILYAGAMGLSYYPMDVIFNAFNLVARSIPNTQLVLCGPHNRRVDDKIRKLGKNVHFLGLLNQEDVARVMQASDIGVISMDERKSTFCALTTKFFEYIASGMPVIASCPTGGELDRLINTEQVGYSVASGDYKTMAEKIIQMLNDNGQRQIFAFNGIKLASTRFNRRTQAKSYYELLLKVKKPKYVH